ncbi:MAG: hypothetical protein R6X29_04660 [Acidimicrobiia bacterium]|jgi:hypothetical protein
MIEPVVVRRSGWRTWWVAILGVPLLVMSADVLTRRRITDSLRGLLFRPEDTQLLEPRDMIWAAGLGLLGLALVLWGLRELIAPTPVLVADGDGLAVRLGNPFGPGQVRLAWEDVDDLGASTVDDDGEQVPVLWVRVFDRSRLPENPWGARWLDERTLAMYASDWERPPAEVAVEAVEVAVAAASTGIVQP